jgi:hypothetical protein
MMVRRVTERFRSLVLRNRKRITASEKLARSIAETLEGRRLMAGDGAGLVANYYSDGNFTNLAAARTDSTVDFNWGTGSPAAGVPAEGFSVRWTGQISAPKSGKYTLTTQSAGGIKVIVDGKVVINDSKFHSLHSASGSFSFTGGEYYDVEIDYQDRGTAAARLLWTAPGGSKQVVPQEDLYRLGTGWLSGGWLSASLGSGNTRAIAGGSLTSQGDSTFTISNGFGGSTTRSISSINDADFGNFAYKTMRQDGSITLKIDSGRANVVFRKTLDNGSPFVDLAVNSGKAQVQYRTTQGGAIQTSGLMDVSGATYVKLARDGDSFAGYVSSTGTDDSWNLVGTAGVIMDTFANVGFQAPGGGTTRAIVSDVRVGYSLALGGNLTKVYDSSPDRPFVDLVKLVNNFQTTSGGRCPVDSNGFPTISDFQAAFAGGGNIAPGRYTITFTGPASAVVNSMRSGVRVTRASISGNGYQVWYADIPNGSNMVGFHFLHMSGWKKDLRVLQPGYSPTNTPIYTAKYLSFLRALHPASLRFMDWLATNETTDANWSERSQPSSTDWADRGVSWEAAIELCNQVGANLYANVPARASDDYVRQLANLIKTKLRKDLNVYLEQGNEVWATNFVNGPWNMQQALNEVKAGVRSGHHSNLNYDNLKVNMSQTSPFAGNAAIWGLRRTARRAKQIGDIFKSVMGASSINTRVRVIIAAQIGNLYTYDVMFKYLNANYGRPGNYIYGMAGAPYFTMSQYNDRFVNGHWTTLTKSATVNQLIGGMQLSSGAYTKQRKFAGFWTHGKPYGVHLVMYEGGHDTFGPFNIAAKAKASLDPRMKTMMKNYLLAFFSQGGSAFNYYTLGADPYDQQFGTWAITPTPNNVNTPKAQAFREIRGGAAANVSSTGDISA